MSTFSNLTKGPFPILFIILLLSAGANGQNARPVSPRQRAMDLLRKNLRYTGLNQSDLSDYTVSDAFEDKRTGDFMVYLQQGYLGIPVYNKIGVYIFRKDSLIGKRADFISRPSTKTPSRMVTGGKATYSLSAGEAVRAAANHLSIAAAPANAPANLVWLPMQDDKELRLSWNVRITTADGNNDWLVRVDAQTGGILQKSSLIVSEKARQENLSGPDCEDGSFDPPSAVTSSSYRVYPFPLESANYGSRVLDTDPFTRAGSGNSATTLGWHYDNTTSYGYTRGNNVWAQQDLAGNNGTGGFGDTSSSSIPILTFDRVEDMTASPTSYSNIRAGLDNLFYWNNIMHDISYQYGFDEAAGNFQTYNQGLGGYGNDYVNAFSQDGAGVNNSDFATPPDGQNPRMRMFLWNLGVTTTLHINSPSAIAMNYVAVEGNLSYKSKLGTTGAISSDIILVNDIFATTHQGCGGLTNAADVVGKVALVDRGGCNFAVKIRVLQSAGAIGVIVINSVAGDPFAMTGVDTSITIPAVMISKTDGDSLKAHLTGLNGVLSATGQYRDGSLDNGVIAHEYTHGISNRLTGGPSNTDCLANAEQMGEGWSDYTALMVTTDWSTATVTDGVKKRTLGTYVLAQPATGPGIRRYPYSTDIHINPWTYDSLATGTAGEAHSIGEIWCATLWDMTWNIIQQEGIDPDIYHGTKGNNIALQLVIQGLKYQPCGPGFLDGRDAILKADSLLYNYAHKCAIWKAFAGRGMGKSASQGSANSYTDQTTATDVPSGVGISQTINKTSPIHGDNVTYTIKASCNCTPMTGISVVDTLSPNLSYVTSTGGTYTSPYVHFDGIDLAAGETKTFTVQAHVTGIFATPDTLINDGRDPANYTWTTTASLGSTNFSEATTRAHSGGHSWYAADAATTTDFALTSGPLVLDTISTLSFWHFYETDAAYDGGVVEISTDGGAHWQDLGPYMTQNPYNSNIALASGSGDREGFSGSSGGAFIQTVISLTGFSGTVARIRFRFTSDNAVGQDGWYIDDIVLKNEKGAVSIANAFSGSTLLSSKRTVATFGVGSLPVNFLSFEAEKHNTSGWLHWRVNGEVNVGEYLVERSADGGSYTAIGEVPGSMPTGTVNDYTFTDDVPLEGNNFYRIEERDLDGKSTFSTIKLLQFNKNVAIIQLYPVPTQGHSVQLEIATDENVAISASLINVVGQIVGVYSVKRGANRLDLSRFSKGVYFLKIQVGDQRPEIRKLIIED